MRRRRALLLALVAFVVTGCGPKPESGSLLIRITPPLHADYVYSVDVHSWGDPALAPAVRSGKLSIRFDSRTKKTYVGSLTFVGMPPEKLEIDELGQIQNLYPPNPALNALGINKFLEGVILPEPYVQYKNFWITSSSAQELIPWLAAPLHEMDLTTTVDRMNYKTVTLDSVFAGVVKIGAANVQVTGDMRLYVLCSDGMPLILSRRVEFSGAKQGGTIITITRESPGEPSREEVGKLTPE